MGKLKLVLYFGIIFLIIGNNKATASLTSREVNDLTAKIGMLATDLKQRYVEYSQTGLDKINYYKMYPEDAMPLGKEEDLLLKATTINLGDRKEGICFYLYKDTLYKIDFLYIFKGKVCGVSIGDEKDRVENILGPPSNTLDGGIIGKYGKEQGQWWEYNNEGNLVSYFISKVDGKVKLISIQIPYRRLSRLIKGKETGLRGYENIVTRMMGVESWGLLKGSLKMSLEIRNRGYIDQIENLIIPSFNQSLLRHNIEMVGLGANEDIVSIAKDIGKYSDELQISYLRGLRDLACERYSEALSNFKKAREKGLADTELHYILAFIYKKTGRLDKAINEYDQLISIEPFNFKARANKVLLMLKKDFGGLAVDILQAPLKEERFDSQRLFILGKVYCWLRNYKMALDVFNRAIDFNKESPALKENIAEVLMKLGRFSEAEENYKFIISRDPDKIRFNYKLAFLYGKFGNTEKSILYTERLADLPIYSSLSYCAIGDCFLKAGDYRNALRNYRRALIINKNCFHAYHGLGAVYKRQGRIKTAERNFGRALRINDSFLPSLLGLSSVYLQSGNLEEAEKLFRKALDLAPYDARVYCYLGITHIINRDHEKGFSLLSEAERLDDESLIVLESKGLAHQLKGEFYKAKAYFQKGLATQPKGTNWHFLLGQLYQLQSRYNDAVGEYEKSLKEGFNAPVIHYNLGAISAIRGETKKAKDLFNRILATNKKSFWAYYGLGVLNREDPGVALSYFGKAMFYNGFGSSEIIYEYAFTQHQLNNLFEAKKWYKRALTINSDLKEARYYLRIILLQTLKPDELIKQVRSGIVIDESLSADQKDFSILLEKANKENLIGYIQTENIAKIWRLLRESNYWNLVSNLNVWDEVDVRDGLEELRDNIKSTFYIDPVWENIMAYMERDAQLLVLQNFNKYPNIQIISVSRNKGKIRDFQELERIYGLDLVLESEDYKDIKILTCGPLLKVAFVGDLFVVGITDSGTMKEVLDLMQNTNYTGPASGSEASYLAKATVYFNLQNIFKSVIDVTANKGLTINDLNQMKYLKGEFVFLPGLIKISWDYKGEDDSDLSIYGGQPSSSEKLIGLIPDDSFLIVNNNTFNFYQWYTTYIDNLKKLNNPGTNKIIESIEKFESDWALNLEKDLLPYIGKSICILFTKPKQEVLVPVPQMAVVLAPPSRKNMDKFLNKIRTHTLHTDKKTGKDVTLDSNYCREKNYKDHQIRSYGLEVTASTSFSRSFIGISYAYLDNFLVLATGDKLIKDIIDGYTDSQLAGRPATTSRIHKYLSVEANNCSYIQIPDLVDLIVTVADWSFSVSSVGFPTNVEELSPQIFERNIKLAASYRTWKEELQPLVETLRAVDDVFSYSIIEKDNLLHTCSNITYKDLSGEMVAKISELQHPVRKARPLVTFYTTVESQKQSAPLSVDIPDHISDTQVQPANLIDKVYFNNEQVIECRIDNVDKENIYITYGQGEEMECSIDSVENINCNNKQLELQYLLYTDASYINDLDASDYSYNDAIDLIDGHQVKGEIVRANNNMVAIKETPEKIMAIYDFAKISNIRAFSKEKNEEMAKLFSPFMKKKRIMINLSTATLDEFPDKITLVDDLEIRVELLEVKDDEIRVRISEEEEEVFSLEEIRHVTTKNPELREKIAHVARLFGKETDGVYLNRKARGDYKYKDKIKLSDNTVVEGEIIEGNKDFVEVRTADGGIKYIDFKEITSVESEDKHKELDKLFVKGKDERGGL